MSPVDKGVHIIVDNLHYQSYNEFTIKTFLDQELSPCGMRGGVLPRESAGGCRKPARWRRPGRKGMSFLFPDLPQGPWLEYA